MSGGITLFKSGNQADLPWDANWSVRLVRPSSERQNLAGGIIHQSAAKDQSTGTASYRGRAEGGTVGRGGTDSLTDRDDGRHDASPVDMMPREDQGQIDSMKNPPVSPAQQPLPWVAQ